MRGSATHTCRKARSLSSSLMLWCNAKLQRICVVILMLLKAPATCPWPGRSKHACCCLRCVMTGQNQCRKATHVLRAGSRRMRAAFARPQITVLCTTAARVTFCPHAQALLRRRQDAIAEKRQPALLKSGAEPRNLACCQLICTQCLPGGNGPSRQHAGALFMRNAYRCLPLVWAVQRQPGSAVFGVGVDEGRDGRIGS